MRRLLLIVLVIGALGALAGCSDSGGSGPTTEAPPTTAAAPSTSITLDATTTTTPAAATLTPSTTAPSIQPVPATFEAGIMPILQTTCAQCHTGSGPGTQHVRLETAQQVADNSSDIALLVGAGLMPPWPASPLSAPFQHDWSLDQAEIAAVRAWHEAGAPLDVDPATGITALADEVSLAEVDLELVPDVGFDGDPSDGDEYRCIIYDPELTEEAWLLGFEFVPDQAEVVHHAIGYRIPASQRERADQKNAAATDGDGWTCFGGSGLGFDEIFVGWAPGQVATRFPAGSGLRMEPGEFLVIQIHYHFDTDAPKDRSSIRLDFAEDGSDLDEVYLEPLLAPAEIPCSESESGPLCDRETALAENVADYGLRGAPADFILALCGQSASDFATMTDGTASSACDTPIGYEATIVSVLGHMHELGTSFRMTLNPDRADEMVLLDIPEWDFDWQFNYNLAVDVALEPGDEIRIECSWDRSLRDPDLEPAYVLWADGTDDEMCFATMVTRSLS
ncbi:MAG: hypothetical protein KJO17_14930 [Acidimicrobiia bacterium]|nr:hypothetical protein [Acidimicrobiia bacterium]